MGIIDMMVADIVKMQQRYQSKNCETVSSAYDLRDDAIDEINNTSMYDNLKAFSDILEEHFEVKS